MSFRNERFVEICGYTEEDISTAEQWWLKAYPDVELRARHRAAWSSALTQARKSGGAIQAAEYSIQCRDGQQRTVEIAGVLVGNDHLLTMVDLSQRKAAEEEIRYLAFYDPLTRLPNRRLLMDRLQQALATSARHQRSGALLLLDLDNFKTLNETQGHDRGDTLLPLVRERAQRKPLERSIQLHANELRTLRGWISRLPDRPQADYLPRLPEPGALTRAQAERQYVQAMLAHHDAVEQLARRAEGVRLRPALKTLLETVRARSQAERPALQARLDALP